MLLLWQFLLMALCKNENSCISNPADTSTMEDLEQCSIHFLQITLQELFQQKSALYTKRQRAGY
jgi:hypothetical protein